MSDLTADSPIERLREFIDRSPTSFHVTENISEMLAASGFTELGEGDAWQLAPGAGYFVRRGRGAVVAFRAGYQEGWLSGMRMAAAHTDSPLLKLKIPAERRSHGTVSVAVEVYGGAIVSTWLDRPLGIAGLVTVRESAGTSTRLYDSKRPMAIIPNLAIHLNRKVNEGFEYNRQDHLFAVLDADISGAEHVLLSHVAADLGTVPEAVLDADLFLYDTMPGQILGVNGTLFSSGRIDNQAAAYAIAEALIRSEPGAGTQLALLFNNEEVGSRSLEGADSNLVRTMVERIVLARGGGREELHRTLARSMLISNDAAHAIHPNFPEKHDPAYAPVLNGGPVIKYNGNLRYTTNAETGAYFRRLCEAAGVPVQIFNNRSDVVSGSTIGPAASSIAEIRSVDVGIPILGMHSLRETAGTGDHEAMIRVLAHFYSGALS